MRNGKLSQGIQTGGMICRVGAMLAKDVCMGSDVGSAREEKVTANPRGVDKQWTSSCELVYVSKSGKKDTDSLWAWLESR